MVGAVVSEGLVARVVVEDRPSGGGCPELPKPQLGAAVVAGCGAAVLFGGCVPAMAGGRVVRPVRPGLKVSA